VDQVIHLNVLADKAWSDAKSEQSCASLRELSAALAAIAPPLRHATSNATVHDLRQLVRTAVVAGELNNVEETRAAIDGVIRAIQEAYDEVSPPAAQDPQLSRQNKASRAGTQQ
jgi:hypothetical protein